MVTKSPSNLIFKLFYHGLTFSSKIIIFNGQTTSSIFIVFTLNDLAPKLFQP